VLAPELNGEVMAIEKPPIGLKPKAIYEEQVNIDRIYEISKAMKRYSDEDNPIPKEWVDELYNRMPRLCGA